MIFLNGPLTGHVPGVTRRGTMLHMPSIRHTHNHVLDAAREHVLEVGVRRLTLTDVARAARMSRMTVYRRFPDVDTLVRDLMTREFSSLIEASREAGTDCAHERARLVAETVAGVRALHDNALFRRVLDMDPELLVPYLVHGLGSTQRYAVTFFADGIQRGQDDASIRDGPVPVLAHGMLLTVQSFALSMRSVGQVMTVDQCCGELALLLDSYLARA